MHDYDCLSGICEGGWCRGFLLPDGRYDTDSDLVANEDDNCPLVWNMDQANRDTDMHGDACDNCMRAANVHQEDTDGDSDGDVCDPDVDGDNVENTADNCPVARNPTQMDCDEDGLGDACDPDVDGDDIPNEEDETPICCGPEELDTDPVHFDPWGCFNSDKDSDGVQDFVDNCPLVHNPEQTDTDGDGYGDLCDPDQDGDGIRNENDNCELVANRHQWDLDRDQVGDVCDDRFCYVADDPDACLDPTQPFTVYAGADRAVPAGERVPLRFWANRQNRAIEYFWILEKKPGRSKAEIENPHGLVSLSTGFNYHYFQGRRAEFTPDEPGEYVFKLSAKLVFDDHLYPDKNVAESSFTLTVDPKSGGCSTGSGIGLGFLALLILLLRRPACAAHGPSGRSRSCSYF